MSHITYLVSVISLLAAPKATGPCELIPPAEIAMFLSVPAVQLDSANTGTNESTKVELCSWRVALRDPRGVTVKVRKATNDKGTEAAMIAARIDEELTLERTEPVRGLGDEAQYAEWKDRAGSTLIVRRGATVLTFTGTVKRETAIAMAKAALGRM